MEFHKRYRFLPVVLLAVLVSACSSTRDTTDWHDLHSYPQHDVLEVNEGIASYYHNKFHGRLTANGERYNKRELTAAHLKYPFGTYVRVTSLDNGSSVIVRINDRGPHIRSRIIDLSRAAAEELDMIHDGLAKVRVEVLAWGDS
ncbi:MAG: septal ring lytic transglycosylase RlpA family lipoprotein [Ignavibacteria bacterium]|nr:MAG: septal ring lytic transglycosylase RlpA family lipoprotein [Ignavibacteria bacterium]